MVSMTIVHNWILLPVFVWSLIGPFVDIELFVDTESVKQSQTAVIYQAKTILLREPFFFIQLVLVDRFFNQKINYFFLTF